METGLAGICIIQFGEQTVWEQWGPRGTWRYIGKSQGWGTRLHLTPFVRVYLNLYPLGFRACGSMEPQKEGRWSMTSVPTRNQGMAHTGANQY